jgi:spermidine synthase
MERFDLIFLRFVGASAWDHVFAYFLATLLVLGPAVVTLGMSLPWLLEASDSPDRWGKLYGVNTLGAVAGSLLAAWLLLPSMGIARTAWLIGGLIAATSFMLSSSRGRVAVVAAGACALSIAILAESGVGRHRIQMQLPNELFKKGIIAFTEGRDSTVSVLEHRDGGAALVIDGFVASNEHAVSHYMDWMGYLPMVLHENPETALVICFGTGQTANAVRQENPKRLDIVELDRNVYSMANYFEKNENVLEDKRVNPIVMDGRAWLRRTRQSYDVITLEPMPPNFAGVNALYSQQFYELARERLNPGGIVAQWMPFHLISPHDAVAIAATFVSVFADSAIWLDPIGKTGILVGRQKTSEQPLIAKWPGLRTTNDKRGMTDDEIKESVALSGETLRRYISAGNSIITDDNQLLSYGPKRHRLKYNYDRIKALNLDLIRRAAQVKTRGVDPRPRGAARKPG